MRVYTVLLSVLVHTFAVGFAIVAPILATVELPEPRLATQFVVVRPVAPPEPQRPAEIKASPPRLSRDVAPVEEPDGVEPEPIEAAVGRCRDRFGLRHRPSRRRIRA